MNFMFQMDFDESIELKKVMSLSHSSVHILYGN